MNTSRFKNFTSGAALFLKDFKRERHMQHRDRLKKRQNEKKTRRNEIDRLKIGINKYGKHRSEKRVKEFYRELMRGKEQVLTS